MNEKEFKNQLATGIKNISLAASSDFTPIEKEKLISMVNFLYKQILIAKFPIEIHPYNEAFKSILNGEIQFYKLNVINLMSAFRIKLGNRVSNVAIVNFRH